MFINIRNEYGFKSQRSKEKLYIEKVKKSQICLIGQILAYF